jgi:hypothetical protein
MNLPLEGNSLLLVLAFAQEGNWRIHTKSDSGCFPICREYHLAVFKRKLPFFQFGRGVCFTSSLPIR